MTLALSERPQVLLEGCWLGKQVGELPLSSSHVRKKTKKCTRGLSRDNMRTLLSCAPGTWMQHLHIADHNPPFFVVVVVFLWQKNLLSIGISHYSFLPSLPPLSTHIIKCTLKPRANTSWQQRACASVHILHLLPWFKLHSKKSKTPPKQTRISPKPCFH